MQIQVTASDANNIICQVTPTPTQTVTIDRGVAGNGIVSIVPVTIGTLEYLRITYTNGTVSDVGPITSTAYTATSPINIVGNTISLLTVPVNLGGTGATTAAAGIQNLLPSYTGNGNKRLGLNSGATALEWVADGGGTVTSVSGAGTVSGLTLTGTVTTSGSLTLGGTLDLSAYNGAGAFTTLSASGAVTLSGGTANGVAYLNGSKVLTTGSALTFDGTNFLIGGVAALANSSLVANQGVAARTAAASGTVPYLQMYNGNAGTDLKTWRIGGGASGQLTVETVNDAYSVATQRMVINSSGNVGIGTSSPGGKVDIIGATNGYALKVGDGTRSGGLIPSLTGGISLYTPDTTPLSFWTNNAERMRLDSAGNVGIGTSSPTSKLQLLQSSTTAYGFISNTPTVGLTANSYVNMAYFANGRGASNDGLRIVNVRDSTGSGIGNWETESYRIRRSVDSNDAGSGIQEEIVFGINILAFSTGGGERARIDSSGNLLVGTTSTVGPGGASIVGGLFRTVAASGTITNATSVTLFTIGTSTTYLVTVQTGNVSGLSTTALVHYAPGGNPVVRTNLVQDNGNFAITISGANVQITNNLGGTVGYTFSAVRIF